MKKLITPLIILALLSTANFALAGYNNSHEGDNDSHSHTDGNYTHQDSYQDTSCNPPTPEPTPEPNPEPTPQPSPQPTPAPEPQPTPEPTPQPTPSPQPTPVVETPPPAPTPEIQPSPSPTPAPSSGSGGQGGTFCINCGQSIQPPTQPPMQIYTPPILPSGENGQNPPQTVQSATCVPIKDFQIENKKLGDHQLELTWLNGNSTITVTQWADGLLPISYEVPDTGFYEVKGLNNNTHYWFKLNNYCSESAAVDPEA